VEKHRLFERVTSVRVDMGFCILAEKASTAKSISFCIEGKTKQERLASLLRCPIDKTRIVFDGDYLCCEHQHKYPVQDGFPVMLGNNAVLKEKTI